MCFHLWKGFCKLRRAKLGNFTAKRRKGRLNFFTVSLNIIFIYFHQITRVNMPHPFTGKARLAYVEFGDEEAMKAGLLEKHAEVYIIVHPIYPP
jgi:hypothetical protein